MVLKESDTPDNWAAPVFALISYPSESIFIFIRFLPLTTLQHSKEVSQWAVVSRDMEKSVHGQES